KDADKKDALLEEQKQKLKALNFNDTFINGFCEALKDGFPEDSSRKDGESGTKGSGPDPNTSNAVIQGLLADMTAKLVTAQEEIAVLTKEKGELSQEVSAKQTEITGLQTKIQTLSGLAEQDGGKGSQHARLEPDAKDIVMNWDDEKQLGGLSGEMFAMDRPYNQRLRAEMLYRKGLTVQVP
ncbi:hypothetical protein ACIXK3_21300, partial [Bacteroides fragilis]